MARMTKSVEYSSLNTSFYLPPSSCSGNNWGKECYYKMSLELQLTKPSLKMSAKAPQLLEFVMIYSTPSIIPQHPWAKLRLSLIREK